MFVSSFSTYIDTNTTKRVQNERSDTEKRVPKTSFESKLSQDVDKNVVSTKELPLNYISNYKSLNNQQKLEQQSSSDNKSKIKFDKLNSISSASQSYPENSEMFSLVQKPKQTINQTPRTDKNLPVVAQDKQESFIRSKMINTYADNENYYNITAA